MSLTAHEKVVEHAGEPSYLLPSDNDEGQRLQAQHRLYTNLLSDRLIFPPTLILSEKDQVLDIGIGAGTWLCDLRTRCPDAVQLYGIDVESRLFPSGAALPPNVHLSVCSGTDLPSSWNSKFTLVTQRLLHCAYTRESWRLNIAEIFRVLAPGGYAQLVEIGPKWVSGPKTATHVLLMDDFFADQRLLFRCGLYISDLLKAAGFIDVTSEEVVMPLGKWAGDAGNQGRDMKIGGYRGMRDSVIKAGGLGRFSSSEDFDKAIDDMAEEWDNIEGSHTVITVCYGRKPL